LEAEDAMDIKQEILDLETRFWNAMIAKDVDGAAKLVAPQSIVTGAQGATAIDRKTFAGMMQGGKWELHAFSFDKVSVVSPAPGVAVIGYVVKEDVTVDGKRMTMEAADASTWVKIGDSWQVVLHTESVLGDPFGRDRKKEPAANAA
jgi:hypothetical protein